MSIYNTISHAFTQHTFTGLIHKQCTHALMGFTFALSSGHALSGVLPLCNSRVLPRILSSVGILSLSDSIRTRTLGVPRAAVRVSHLTPLEFYSRTSLRASSTRIVTRWVLPTCEFYSHHNIYYLWEFKLHLFLSSYELPSVEHLLVRQILVLGGDFTQIPKLLLKGLRVTLDPLT